MPLHFLNSPLGVICLVIIGATSLINIYAHWIEDGLVGRLLYMATVLTCSAGAFTNNISVITSSLIILFTLKSIRNVCVRSIRYMKYRRTINAQHKR